MKSLITLTSVLMLGTVACGKQSNSSDNAAVVAPLVDTANGSPTIPETPAAGETPAAETPAQVVSFEVDATDKNAFAHLDLDSGKIVPESDPSWDLAFKRTTIKMNADVKAQVVSDSTFDAIAQAPAGDYLADAPVASGKETDGLVFHSGLGWYSYDMDIHVISSNDYVYFVRTNSGAEFKLSVTDYYNVDRLPAFIQLKWLEVAAATTAE